MTSAFFLNLSVSCKFGSLTDPINSMPIKISLNVISNYIGI